MPQHPIGAPSKDDSLARTGECPWQDGRYVLRQFSKRLGAARRRYLAFVEAGMEQGRREDLTGGGLIHSLGGWSEVKRLSRSSRERVKGDERILGDSEFVLQILEQANERLDRRYELASRGWDEKRVARRVADIYGIAADEMFRKGQKRRIAEARGLFCHWCRQELGLSVTALARMLSLTPAAVFYAARRGERFAADNGFVIEPFQCGAKPPYTGHTPDRSARLPAKCPTITA